MRRHLFSLAFLIAGMAWLAAGAPGCGEGSPVRPEATFDVENPNCNPEDEECREKIAEINRETAGIPLASQEQKDKAREIILADPVVQKLVVGRNEGKDYTLGTEDSLGSDKSAAKQGPVLLGGALFLNPPAQYSGPIPQRTRPCEGHGYEGYVEKDDPCLNIPVEYVTQEVTWDSLYGVYITVNLHLGKVVDIQVLATTPEILPTVLQSKGAE